MILRRPYRTVAALMASFALSLALFAALGGVSSSAGALIANRGRRRLLHRFLIPAFAAPRAGGPPPPPPSLCTVAFALSSCFRRPRRGIERPDATEKLVTLPASATRAALAASAGSTDPSDELGYGDGNGDGDGGWDADALARRISSLSDSESRASSAFEDGLRRRVRDLAAADDEFEASMTASSSSSSSSSGGKFVVRLPVLCFDAILPGQRLSGSSEDPVFSRLLVELGLGGTFVMISLNHKQRKLRRSGTVCRVEMVDVDRGCVSDPTAVTFAVAGKRRCRVVGPAEGMEARVGRWRRGYDPDGEEARLGWGTEKFVDMEMGLPGVVALEADGDNDDDQRSTDPLDDDRVRIQKNTEWTVSAVDCSLVEGVATVNEGEDENLLSRAQGINSLIDRWIELASDPGTYDNVDVVASTRRKKGEPGLRIDPSRLLRNVAAELGERPDPAVDLTGFALWSAALINPLPPLGVSPEIRGMMLEAPDAGRRLNILERGLKRSIANLEGTAPL